MQMTEERKQQLWKSFTTAHQVSMRGVPLFEENDTGVIVFPYGSNGRPMLRRSSSMEAMMRALGAAAISEYNRSADDVDGILYMMFRNVGPEVVPLYVGKSELYGKGDRNLSANIADLASGGSMFGRWGYNYAYHIGDLSAATLDGHPPAKRSPKYVKWSSSLFDIDGDIVRPKFQIRFWSTLWSRDSQSIWADYGGTRLAFEEYLLIGIGSDLFPNDLLNNEGRNR